MESRRNLENIYKRRLEDAEKKRFQSALHLAVLKQYVSLTRNKNKPIRDNTIIQQLNNLENAVKELRKSMNVSESSGHDEDIYSDSMNISNSNLDKLQFSPTSIKSSFVISLLKEIFNISTTALISSLDPDMCINTDIDMLSKILNGFKYMFSFYAINPQVQLIHDNTNFLLQFSFSDQSHKMVLLQTPFEKATAILNGNIVEDLDDVTSTMFICQSLCQSMGGDLERVQSNNTFRVFVPCEVMPNDQCLVTDAEPPIIPKFNPLLEQQEQQQQQQQQQQPNIKSVVDDIKNIKVIPAPPSPPSTPALVTKTLEGRILNILLVEDGTVLQKVFTKWWQNKGHNVFIASNGQEAIEMFKTRPFSIIFMDVEIPIKNGLLTTREIRAYEIEKSMKATPIIGVSGYTEKGYKDKAIESGMNEFVSKGQGYQFNEIYKIVVDYCGYEKTI